MSVQLLTPAGLDSGNARQNLAKRVLAWTEETGRLQVEA